jgi:tetratricopeptide (TPR) repeat protein
MQARLAALSSPVAGGTGLQARRTFDRTQTDPLLEKADQALASERGEEAEAFLRKARALEPADPRVPLRLADMAEQRGEMEEAAAFLEEAVALDPSVPLVHYRLGLVHKRLGNRSQAVFHLEQAASGFGPTSSLRARTELEIRTLSFPLLQDSGIGIGGRFDREERIAFTVGETVTWWGSVSPQLINQNPLLRVRWIDPAGALAQEDAVRMDPFGFLSAELHTRDRTPGIWEVRVLIGDSEVDRRTFRTEALGVDPLPR